MTDATTQRALGRVEGELGGLKTQIETLTKAVQAQGERQHESQTRLYRRLDEQAEIVAATTRRLGTVEATVKSIEPLAHDFAKLKQRGLGAMAVVMLFWLLLGGAITQGIASVWLWVAKAVTHTT